MKSKSSELLMISYLDYPYPAGLCTRITALAKILVRNGIKVNILAPITRGDKNLPEREQRDGFVVTRIDLKFYNSTGNFALKLLQLLIFSIIASFKVSKIFVKKGPLIQYQSIYSAIPALFAKTFLRAKIIGDDIVLIHPFIDILVLKLTDIVVTPSLKTYSFAKQLRKLTLYVPNGAEKKVFTKSTLDIPRILFIGSLSFDQNLKAVENIVRIASKLDEYGLTFEIIIVGGPLTYAKHLVTHPIVKKGKVIFVGIVSDEQLTNLYSSSLIGLLPFFYDTPLTGGQRTKALEFFANGLLVISGPEGVKGIHGIEVGKHYLLANSIEEMIEIIKNVLLIPKVYQNVADEGQKFILERYSWEMVSKDYVSLISGFSARGSSHP